MSWRKCNIYILLVLVVIMATICYSTNFCRKYKCLVLELIGRILLVSKLNKQMTASLHKHQLHYIYCFLFVSIIDFLLFCAENPKISQINKSWFVVSKHSSERLMHCHFNFVALLLKNNIICFQKRSFLHKKIRGLLSVVDAKC